MSSNSATLPERWNVPPASLSLHDQDVHVWRVRLDHYEEMWRHFLPLLSRDELARATFYLAPHHRARAVLSRALLRQILARYLATQPDRLRFSYGPDGKPGLGDASLIFFNVAHSHNIILYAIAAEREIGVDVEFLRVVPEALQIAERYFSPREYAALRSLPVAQRQWGFFTCWTRREAFLKAVGTGLARELDRIEVPGHPHESPRLWATEEGQDQRDQWRLIDVLPAADYVGALAITGGVSRICYWDGMPEYLSFLSGAGTLAGPARRSLDITV